MAAPAVSNLHTESPGTPSNTALPGLGRAMVVAGKLAQKTAEDLYKNSIRKKSSFIAELLGCGLVSAAEMAHTLSHAFAAPLINLDAVDTKRLPKGLLDAKICKDFCLVVLNKRNNRLLVATADPTDQNVLQQKSSFPPG